MEGYTTPNNYIDDGAFTLRGNFSSAETSKSTFNPRVKGHEPGDATERGKLTSWRKKLSREFPEAVGVSGIRHIFNGREQNIRRTLWGFLLLCTSGMMVYQIAERICYYTTYPTSSDIQLKFVHQLDFPSVVICNYNIYRKSYVQAYPAFAALLEEHYNQTIAVPRASPNYSAYAQALYDVNMTEFMLNAGHQLDDSLILASYNQEVLSPSNFSVAILDYGVCFTFNMDSSTTLKVDSPGKSQGLEVALDLQQWDYYFSAFGRVSAGFQILAFDRHDAPLVNLYGIAVAAGTESLIGLAYQEAKNLEPPFGECDDDVRLSFTDTYNEKHCKLECLLSFVVTQCGCRAPFMPGPHRVCNPVEMLGCAEATIREHSKSDWPCSCPIPCEKYTYTARVSTAKFPSDLWANTLPQIYKLRHNTTRDAEYFRNNICYIKIYLEELSILKIKQQQAYPFFSLLSDIGGALGLWIGGSILTLFEVVDLFGYTFGKTNIRKAQENTTR